MARSRKKVQENTATETTAGQTPATEPVTAEQPKVHIQPEGIVHAPAAEPVPEQPRQPEAEHPSEPHHGHAARHHRREQAPGFIANPSSRRRESHAEGVRKLPGKLSVKAGDLTVRMIDAGDNRMGIGIKVEVPDDRHLTAEEIDIIRKHVRGEDGEHTGFRWDHDNKMWHKAIVQNFENPDEIPLSRPKAIRLDAESRVEKLAAALRRHQGKDEGFAQTEEHRQEHSAGHGGRS